MKRNALHLHNLCVEEPGLVPSLNSREHILSLHLLNGHYSSIHLFVHSIICIFLNQLLSTEFVLNTMVGIQFSWSVRSICDPMDCSTTGFPVQIMSFESVMPSNHLILCRPFLLLPSIFPSIRVFSNESVLCTRWPPYWSFSLGISPSNEYSGLISFRIDCFDLLASKRLLRVFSNNKVQKHQFFSAQLSL